MAKENCSACNDLLSPGKVSINISFENVKLDVNESSIKAKEEFVPAITRGGLTKPSDYIYISSVHASALHSYLSCHDDLRKSLLSTGNPRDTFVSYILLQVTNVLQNFLKYNAAMDINMIDISAVLHLRSSILVLKTTCQN